MINSHILPYYFSVSSKLNGDLLHNIQTQVFFHRSLPAVLSLPSSTMKIQLHNQQFSYFLCQANKMRLSGVLCDTVIVVENQTFKAHSLVLACASKKLENHLTSKEDGQQHHCTLNRLSSHTFQQILDYVYMETLEVSAEDLRELLNAAQLLEMHQLGQQCHAQLETLNLTAGGRQLLAPLEVAGIVGEGLTEMLPSSPPLEEQSVTSPSPPHHYKKPKTDNALPVTVPPRVSVIASTTTRLPNPSSCRSPRLGWHPVTASPRMTLTSTDFMAIRSLHPPEHLVACPFPVPNPMYPLFSSPALPQGHNPIMGYAGIFHPLHPALLPGSHELAMTVKNNLPSKGDSVDGALMGSTAEDDKRKLPEAIDKTFHCQQPGEIRDSHLLQTHAVSHPAPAESLLCLLCGKSFRSQASPREQQSLHSTIWGHICTDCRRSFPSHAALRRHQRLHTRPSDMTLGCKYCGRYFRDEGSLRSHRRVHSGEKPYQCERCPKRFSLKHQLDTHHRVHTGTVHGLCSTPACSNLTCTVTLLPCLASTCTLTTQFALLWP
ncbi:uncharacterized protein [Paramormyrops kingsleyae]|uniref:uncharacterized protein isoform X1 n=1 Tax=Paramormyrops kingsleyae TaxID=1676925 RepID=UPI003B96C356